MCSAVPGVLFVRLDLLTNAELTLHLVMPSKILRSQTLRYALFFFAFALIALLAQTPYLSPNVSHSSHAQDRSVQDKSLHDKSQNSKLAAKAALLNLPLSFEPADSPNTFLVRGSGYRLLLTASQAMIALKERRNEKVLQMKLAGANSRANPVILEELPGKRNYLIGNNPEKWRTNVPTYSRIRFDEVYRGISVTYYGNQHQLEYDFELMPGADPRAIRLTFNRRVRPHVSIDGDLLLQTDAGEVREQKPLVYQEVDGERHLIEARYVVVDRRQIAFEIGPYDRGRKLVIDPTLVYSTYLGGSGDDIGSSIAVDSSNNVYVAGTTSSTNFPTGNPAFPGNSGLSDICVTKIEATGGNIVYSTYIG